MDLLTIVRTVLRRWYIALPVIAAVLYFALTMQSSSEALYEATGSVILEEPTLDPSRLPGPEDLVDEFNETDNLDAPTGAEIRIQALDRSTIGVMALAEEPAPAEHAITAVYDWARIHLSESQEADGVPEDERIQITNDTPFIFAQARPGGGFQASGTITLADPWAGFENPFRPGLTTSRVLEAAIMSDHGQTRVLEHVDGQVSFSVHAAVFESPILEVNTIGRDPATTVSAFDSVRHELNEELTERQERAGVPQSRHLAVAELAVPEYAVDVSAPLDRSALGLAAGGLLLAIALAIGVDGAITRRRAARQARQGPRTGSPWGAAAAGGLLAGRTPGQPLVGLDVLLAHGGYDLLGRFGEGRRLIQPWGSSPGHNESGPSRAQPERPSGERSVQVHKGPAANGRGDPHRVATKDQKPQEERDLAPPGGRPWLQRDSRPSSAQPERPSGERIVQVHKVSSANGLRDPHPVSTKDQGPQEGMG